LLILAEPLGEGDFVQVAFQTSKGAVHGMAEILTPRVKSNRGCLQPFRFVALRSEIAYRDLIVIVNSIQNTESHKVIWNVGVPDGI